MINDDILIKFCRARGFKHLTWPEQVNYMKTELTKMKLGFPGIGNDHMSLVEFKDIKVGDIFIINVNVEKKTGDDAPIMYRILDNGKYLIEGIGAGRDSKDPNRILTRWLDIKESVNIPDDFLVFRVDVRPDFNGGPGYYYFFKSFRDFRD